MKMDQSSDLEKKRLILLSKLDASKDQAERNKLGQYATPIQLAVDIVDYVLSLLPLKTAIHYLEPGFGTGPFYSALLMRASDRIVRSVGIEIDPAYAEPAREIWQNTGLNINIGDFTTTTPPQDEDNKFNLIICNPPYVRHHHISPAQKRKLQVLLAQNVNFELNGLSGLYTYFMLLSQAWMASNGIGAWLVPSEFMDVNYGSKVKEFLLSRVSLLRIHRFDPNDVQFTDALVSSAIVVYKNCLPNKNHLVQLSSGSTLLKPNKLALFDTETLYRSNKWSSLITRTSGSVATSQTEKSEIQTLGELFTIKRGIATGCNSFFIVTRQRAVEMNLPKKFLIPILPGPRELEVDFIEANQNGDPKISNPHYLISCNLPEAILKEEYPDLWKYFQIGVEQRINERYLSRHRTPWYSQEIRPPAPFLCTYMGRSGQNSASPFRFITNRSRATAPNVYLMLYPKNKLAFWLGNDSKLYASIGKALSSIAPDMLIGKGRVYGGGLYKLEPNELANVPANIVLDVIKVDKDISLPIQLKMF